MLQHPTAQRLLCDHIVGPTVRPCVAGPHSGPLSTSPPGQEQKRCCLCTAHVNGCASDYANDLFLHDDLRAHRRGWTVEPIRNGTGRRYRDPRWDRAERVLVLRRCRLPRDRCLPVLCRTRGRRCTQHAGRTSGRRPGPAEGRRRAAGASHPGRPDEHQTEDLLGAIDRAIRPCAGRIPSSRPGGGATSWRSSSGPSLPRPGSPGSAPRRSSGPRPWSCCRSSRTVRRLVWVRVRAVVLQRRLRTASACGPRFSTATPGASRRSCGLRRGARPTAA